MSNCKEIIDLLNSMLLDYRHLTNYINDIDTYQIKKQELLDTYFSKYNNGKEWYYKLKDLNYCFTSNQIRKFADLFQQFQTGDNYTFMSPYSEIRLLQQGRRCKYEHKWCAKGDTCYDHSIKHRIDYVHNCGPVWVSYISQLINNLKPKNAYGKGLKKQSTKIRKSRRRKKISKKHRRSHHQFRRRSRHTSKRKLK